MLLGRRPPQLEGRDTVAALKAETVTHGNRLLLRIS